MGAKDKAAGKRKHNKKESEANADSSQKRGKKDEQEAEPASESKDEFEVLDEDEDESDSGEGEPTAAELFEEEIKKREAEMGRHCMVVGTLDIPSEDEEDEESGSDDDKAPTMEQLQQLARVWVPKEVETYFSALAEELQAIGCTDDEESDDDDEMETLEGQKLTAEQKAAAKKAMQEAGWVMRMLSTRHSYPMHAILNNSLGVVDKAIKNSKWEEAFCHWAATLQAARRETHWFSDTDVPAEVEKIYEKLRTQWLKLEKHSDQKLGGLLVEGDAKSTKEAFSSFLQGLADELGEFEYKAKEVVKKSKK